MAANYPSGEAGVRISCLQSLDMSFFFFQAEDGIRDSSVTGVQTCALPICDFTPDIVEAIERQPKICDHVHLPVQSGSTRVLRAMQRTYSREEYLEKIAMIH